MAFTFTTSGAVKLAAGANASSDETNITGAELDTWSDEAEDYLCAIARSDLIGNFGSLKTNGKKMLGRTENAMLGAMIIQRDSGAIGNAESLLRLNTLENQKDEGITMLKEDKNKTYLGIT